MSMSPGCLNRDGERAFLINLGKRPYSVSHMSVSTFRSQSEGNADEAPFIQNL